MDVLELPPPPTVPVDEERRRVNRTARAEARNPDWRTPRKAHRDAVPPRRAGTAAEAAAHRAMTDEATPTGGWVARHRSGLGPVDRHHACASSGAEGAGRCDRLHAHRHDGMTGTLLDEGPGRSAPGRGTRSEDHRARRSRAGRVEDAANVRARERDRVDRDTREAAARDEGPPGVRRGVIGDVDGEARTERRPADVLRAVAPGHPGRRPLVARDPDPSLVGVIGPSAVVVRRPSPRLVRDPQPSLVRPFPAAVVVGAPAGGDVRGPPDPTIVRHRHPLTVRSQAVLEGVEADRGAWRREVHRDVDVRPTIVRRLPGIARGRWGGAPHAPPGSSWYCEGGSWGRTGRASATRTAAAMSLPFMLSPPRSHRRDVLRPLFLHFLHSKCGAVDNARLNRRF